MREILKKVSGALKFSDYTEADTQEMLDVQTYLTDKTLGGGPIIGKKIFKDGANPIETPIRSIWQNMYKKITKAYKAGNEQEGGLFYIKNVQLDDPKVDGNQYVDVFLATTSAEDYNALIGKNNTDEIKCCFNDHLEGEGLKLNFNGLARIIQYTRDEEDKNKVAIERVWDGQVKEGVPAGFGRLVDGLQSSSFIGQLYDTKATYKGLYYEGLQPKYQGIYDNVDYDVEPTNFQFANFKPEKVDTVIEPTDEEKKKIKEEAKKAGIREENALDPSKNKGAFKKKRQEKELFNKDDGTNDLLIDKADSELDDTQKKKKVAQEQVLSFTSKLLETVDTSSYPATEKTLKAAKRLENKLIGGGPMATPKLAGSTDYPIDSSSKSNLKELMTKLESGVKKGGYFNFTDVKEDLTKELDATQKATIRRGVKALITDLDDADYERLKKLNNTKDAVWKDGKDKDGNDVKGIESLMNGQAIVERYVQFKDKKEKGSLLEVLEGAVKAGKANGFVRLTSAVSDLTVIGEMEDNKPVGRIMKFDKDDKLTVGTYDKAENKKITDEPSDTGRFASFDKTNTTVVKDF